MMRVPEFITFTGIDDRTDLTKADRLASMYPIEWGVLFNSNSSDARFPSSQAVDEILQISGMKSAHICGDLSKQLLCGQDICVPLEHFGRVQINSCRIKTDYLHAIEKRYCVDVVVQTRSEFSDIPFQQLFDISGGRGKLPEWVPSIPDEIDLVGFAGGIGPSTVDDYLRRIQGTGSFWIDMEGHLRVKGWFSLEQVEAVCQRVFG